MKGMEQARQQDRQEEVMRMRLRWPGNFIGLRYDSTHRQNITASDLEGYPEWPCLAGDDKSGTDGDSLSSESSYTIMPATTIPAVNIKETIDHSSCDGDN